MKLKNSQAGGVRWLNNHAGPVLTPLHLCANVSDPKNVPDVMLLYGYLGASSEEGHERLYLSPDLTNYVEVPRDAVLHQMAAPKEQDPHGGVTLWVKKDAKLIYKMAPAAEALAHYFAGAVQAAAGQAAAAPAVRPTPPVTIVGPCLSYHVTCMHFCTHITPCHPTHGQPQCPFPTEVTMRPGLSRVASSGGMRGARWAARASSYGRALCRLQCSGDRADRLHAGLLHLLSDATRLGLLVTSHAVLSGPGSYPVRSDVCVHLPVAAISLLPCFPVLSSGNSSMLTGVWPRPAGTRRSGGGNGTRSIRSSVHFWRKLVRVRSSDRTALHTRL
jgi:hypothetical protein